MIKITFPDGSVREYENGISAYQIAMSISPRLASDVLAATVNGAVVDLERPITEDATLKLHKWEDEEAKKVFWHSSSHLMAEALEALYPGIKFGIGPAIDNGFYYDVDLGDKQITDADLKAIEDKMVEFARQGQHFVRKEVPKAEAMKTFTEKGDQYKCELIEGLEDGHISFYTNGSFTDLCRGPHLRDTSVIKAIKLTSIAGAYWRGDEHNKMLTRIYGTAFKTKDELEKYLVMIEEAKKRDHRKLGKELGLFMFSEYGPGFPFYLPNGMTLKNQLIDYWRELHRKNGYVEISTPIILNRSLWETSGHWDHYKENMYTTVIDDQDFAVKPMNCPGSILVYQSEPRSYRDLPLRFAELGLVHRHEKSGELHGMFRVRCFTQDDAHTYIRPDQIQDEVRAISNLINQFYQLFGFKYFVELSTRPENSMGSDEDWELATEGLRVALDSMGMEYTVNEGDGAFYGPKIDFHLTDCLGRTWQCGTIQLDFQLPLNFELEYTDRDGEKKRPIMIHRAGFGSFERFIGMLTEQYAGKFPTWLAPTQVKVLPVSEKTMEYSQSVFAALRDKGIRVVLDDRGEKIGYKIREAQQVDRVPYMLILGPKESETGEVSVRNRSGETETMSLEAFTEKVLKEIADRA